MHRCACYARCSEIGCDKYAKYGSGAIRGNVSFAQPNLRANCLCAWAFVAKDPTADQTPFLLAQFPSYQCNNLKSNARKPIAIPHMIFMITLNSTGL